MYDKQLVLESLQNIGNSLQEILEWTAHVTTVDDFLLSSNGMMMLNAVCMKLLAVGEEVKSIDKRTNKGLLPLYPAIRWKDVMGMRDIVAHHYFEIDANRIFDTLHHDVPFLLTVIRGIEKDLLKTN